MKKRHFDLKQIVVIYFLAMMLWNIHDVWNHYGLIFTVSIKYKYVKEVFTLMQLCGQGLSKNLKLFCGHELNDKRHYFCISGLELSAKFCCKSILILGLLCSWKPAWSLSMLNCFQDYEICLHILYILDFLQYNNTRFTIEQQHSIWLTVRDHRPLNFLFDPYILFHRGQMAPKFWDFYTSTMHWPLVITTTWLLDFSSLKPCGS